VPDAQKPDVSVTSIQSHGGMGVASTAKGWRRSPLHRIFNLGDPQAPSFPTRRRVRLSAADPHDMLTHPLLSSQLRITLNSADFSRGRATFFAVAEKLLYWCGTMAITLSGRRLRTSRDAD
jgi:hypothetical protein